MGKTLYIIAGCNGAGKTTAAYTLLPEMYKCKEFVNSDEIAKGLSPFRPESVNIQAGKIMLNRIDELLESNKSFAVETTLSSRYYVNVINRAHEKGFVVFLLFFWLHSPEMAIRRVAQRVSEGGHSVPVNIIKRRYHAGINNFFRYRRYRLALYVAWIQGAHENNTEEGLWHMEERYTHHHRHSVAAKEHLKMDQDLYRYIRTHARRGRLRAPVAVMYGRYDGFSCFGGGTIFGMPKQNFHRDFDAEQSWHIPRATFHPNTVKGFSATAHGEKSKKGPIGLVSGNPYGNFNVVPVEENYPDYPLLAYFSYNCAEKEDLDRLYEKVKAGATVLMTLAHLTCTTDRRAIENYELEFERHPFTNAIGFDYDKKCIPNAGKVAEVTLGKGRAIVFNTLLYPANPEIKDEYTARFIAETEKINARENAQPIVDSSVHATVYDTAEGCGDIYYITVDWWNEPEALRKAGLRLGGHEYDMSLPFGVMKKVVFRGDAALVCERESGEVLSFDGKTAVVQGDGEERFTLLRDGKKTAVTVDFENEVQKTIKL